MAVLNWVPWETEGKRESEARAAEPVLGVTAVRVLEVFSAVPVCPLLPCRSRLSSSGREKKHQRSQDAHLVHSIYCANNKRI